MTEQQFTLVASADAEVVKAEDTENTETTDKGGDQ